MKFRASIHKKLFLSHFLAVLFVSGSIGTYFYLCAYTNLKESLQRRLLNSAALISENIDGKELIRIHAPDDISLPEYTRYLYQLRRLRIANPDIAFLYVMRLKDDRVYFVIDSDETEKQALPGREYTHIVPSLLDGFKRPTVDQDIFQDEWGSFMSGYAPIKNGDDKLLVGMDMRANEVQEKFKSLRFSGILSFFCSILLAYVFSRFLSQRFVSGIRLLIDSCRAIADGRMDQPMTYRSGDEIDHLVTAFNHMSEKLSVSAQRARRAEASLIELNEQLDHRVQDRTHELESVNTRLKAEIAKRQKIEAELAEAARTDPLTGLLNRRSMQEYLDYMVTSFIRNRQPFTLLMVDIDHFKSINDHYGHQIGDAVLIFFSRALKSQVRKRDLVARWGGEEFMICLPETDQTGGIHLAEKIREFIAEEEMGVNNGPDIRITVSIGVSEYIKDAPIDHSIRAADEALYHGKGQGRDVVVGYAPIKTELPN
jgi:diguanylate cyclase (GGDEF)-like protein